MQKIHFTKSTNFNQKQHSMSFAREEAERLLHRPMWQKFSK